MPRIQNEYRLYTINATTLTKTLLTHATHAQYFELTHNLKYIAATHQYIDLVQHDDFLHIALYDMSGTKLRMLTSGSHGVRDIFIVSADSIIYYASTQVGPMHLAIYALDINTNTTTKLVDNVDSENTYQQASFSYTSNYFLLQEHAPPQPSSTLYATRRHDKSAVLTVLQNNTQTLEAHAQLLMPTTHYFTIPSLIAGRTLNAYMIVPHAFDINTCGESLPLVVFAYNGPGNQQVTSQFVSGGSGLNGLHTYLASSHRTVVLVIDAIGTGGQGESFQKQYTYMNMGVKESEDMIHAIQHVLTSKCFLNREKVAYYGYTHVHGVSCLTLHNVIVRLVCM